MFVLVRVGRAHRPAVGFSSPGLLSVGDVQQLRSVVASLVQVAETWNGSGFHNYGLEVEVTPSQSVTACLERFKDGCPRHRIASWCKDCNWLETGLTRTVVPTGWRPLRSL